MTRSFLVPVLLAGLPGVAFALPAPGDILGTDATTVRAALEAQGCPVTQFEIESGKVEAKCRETATGKVWEIYIDPRSGAVAKIEQDD